MGILEDIGRRLREGFFMFWERPVRASGLGMVSSSCSYAATAMSKSRFQKGADFTTAMIFMFASTNLVVALGIVLVVLMGWQFAAAEFVGGPIMILILAVTGSAVMGRRLVSNARKRLQSGTTADGYDLVAMVGVTDERQAELERTSWGKKLRSRAAWADAASSTVADLRMLRRELVVGPFIVIISFVCSIGNVPMAAALWRGDIRVGGVIAFIFADLIAFPLLLIYRKYYGTQIAIRLLVWFWALMAISGLVVELIFDTAGLIPTSRPRNIAETSFHWNYTTILNLRFLAVAGYLYWLYRNRDRLGGGTGYAIDSVCGMQVQTANAPAHARHDEQEVWFCSDHCAGKFQSDPVRFAGAG